MLEWTPEAVNFWALAALFVMCFVGVSPVPLPLPITLTLFWLAQFDMPVTVILVATVGTVLGWVQLEPLFRRWVLRPGVQNAIPVTYQKFFLRQTGLWLFFFNAIPFPWDPMRLLALLNDYPKGRFLLILGVSRLIRNTLLVLAGMLLAPYKLLFWGAFIFLMLLPFLTNWVMKRVFASTDRLRSS